jgi:hypothetical protein
MSLSLLIGSEGETASLVRSLSENLFGAEVGADLVAAGVAGGAFVSGGVAVVDVRGTTIISAALGSAGVGGLAAVSEVRAASVWSAHGLATFPLESDNAGVSPSDWVVDGTSTMEAAGHTTAGVVWTAAGQGALAAVSAGSVMETTWTAAGVGTFAAASALIDVGAPAQMVRVLDETFGVPAAMFETLIVAGGP